MENEMYENRTLLIGFLGKDPERKSTKANKNFAVLSVATKTRWQDTNEQWQEKTEWHRVVCWQGLTEYALRKLVKGDHVYCEGLLVSSIYNKEIGKGNTKTTVPITQWHIMARTLRKLNRAEGTHDALPDFEREPGDE